MGKNVGMWFVATTMVLWCALTPLQSQEETKPGTADNRAKTERRDKPIHAYRIDFSIAELEDGKKINSRHYSIDLNSGERNQVKIGTRVPVVSQSSPNQPEWAQFQYLDVGTDINCRLEEQGDQLALEVHAEFSNLASATEQHSPQPPIIRQINISGTTLADTGKPVIIGAVDDPNSKRTFQLEATATRLK
jgi:hypothetical protein